MIAKQNFYFLSLVIIGTLSPTSFAEGNPDDAKALAIIKSKCVACHNTTTAESDIILETREQLLAAHNEKSLVAPGKHAESLVWQLASRKVEPVMPPADNDVGATPLTDEEIALLAGWIDRGAVWSQGDAVAMKFRDLPADKLPIQSVAMQPDGTRAAVAWGNRVGVVRIPGGEVEGWLLDPKLTNPTTGAAIKATDVDFVQAVAISNDGQHIATGGFRSFRLWKKKAPEKEKQVGIESPAPGKWIVGGTHAAFVRDDGSFTLIDVQSNAVLNPNTLVLGQPLHQISFHPTEPIVAICRKDQILLTYHLQSGELKVLGKLNALPEQIFVLGIGDVAILRAGNLESYQYKNFENPSIDIAPAATAGVADAANPLVTALTAAYPDWRPAVDLAAMPNSPYADWDLATLQWQAQIAARKVQSAEGDVKAAQEELKGEETNKQTLDGEVTKGQTAVDEAKKELAAKPEDMPIAEKVKKAEAGLETAKDAVKRADERIVALKEKITGLETVTNQMKQASEQAQKASTDFQAQLGTGVSKPTIAAAERGRSGWKAIVDQSGSLSLLDGANQTVTAVRGQVKDANSLKSLGNDRWWIGFGNGKAEIWKLPTGWDLAAGLGSPLDANPFPDRVTALAFSPDASKLVIGSGEPSRSGMIYLFDLASNQIVKSLPDAHSDVVVSLAYSPDGAQLASGGADRMAKIWKADSLEFIKTLEGHTHHVNSVSWNCDGRQLLTASADTTVKVWNVSTAQQIKTLDLGDAELNAAVFVAQADQMVVAASTQPVTRRNTSDAGQQNAYACDSDYTFGIAIDRTGQRILAGGSQGTLRGWKVDQTAILKLATPTVP